MKTTDALSIIQEAPALGADDFPTYETLANSYRELHEAAQALAGEFIREAPSMQTVAAMDDVMPDFSPSGVLPVSELASRISRAAVAFSEASIGERSRAFACGSLSFLLASLAKASPEAAELVDGYLTANAG